MNSVRKLNREKNFRQNNPISPSLFRFPPRPGVLLPGRQADRVGRVHDQQGARGDDADDLGDGVRLRSLGQGGGLRRARQQGDGVPAGAGRRRRHQEEDRGDAHIVHVVLPLPGVGQPGGGKENDRWTVCERCSQV